MKEFGRRYSTQAKTSAFFALVGVICAIFLAWLVSNSLLYFQYSVSVLTVVIAVLTDRRFRELPALMRPALPVCIAAIISAVYATGLSDDDYASYTSIWALQMLGFVLAMLINPITTNNQLRSISITQSQIEKLAKILLALAVLCFLAFVGLKGIPALGNDVEQGRVDAASSGTGYIRLMAYMSVPSSLILVAVKARHRWIYVALTIVLILAMGNRSPLLYLLVPLIFLYPLARGKKPSSIPLIAAIALIAIGIVGVGTYRVVSQESFRSYSEYRVELAQGDYLGVALTTFEHYAGVVPDNAVLAKSLIDSGKLNYQYGSTYFTLFITALPGEQPSLDRTIKQLSNKNFVGGGTPPTLMGEGYINAGYLGTLLGSAFVMWISRFFAVRTCRRYSDTATERILRVSYGYVLTWATTCQVAGLTGASTVPLAGFLALSGLIFVASKNQTKEKEAYGNKPNRVVSRSG